MTPLMRFRAWAGPLAVAGLLAGCQSSRPAFVFAPATAYLPTSRPAPIAPATPAAASNEPTTAALPTAAGIASRPWRAMARRQLVAAWRPKQLAQPGTPSAAAALAQVAATEAGAPVVAGRRPHRQHGATARTAENGLGGIALFFIGAALALLAGLGALVALIPGVSFWGGVGLAAAGLLVIFLLYSLLSGGKKTKK